MTPEMWAVAARCEDGATHIDPQLYRSLAGAIESVKADLAAANVRRAEQGIKPTLAIAADGVVKQSDIWYDVAYYDGEGDLRHHVLCYAIQRVRQPRGDRGSESGMGGR